MPHSQRSSHLRINPWLSLLILLGITGVAWLFVVRSAGIFPSGNRAPDMPVLTPPER